MQFSGGIDPTAGRYREEKRSLNVSSAKILHLVDRTRATYNLRDYIRRAVLPGMVMDPGLVANVPPPDRRSHAIHLSVGFSLWRVLQYMEPLYTEELNEDVVSFTKRFLPTSPCNTSEPDYVTGEWLTVPCQAYETMPVRLSQIEDCESMRRWVAEYPLATVQRLLHVIFPESSPWLFQRESSHDPDDEIVASYAWEAKNRKQQVLNTTLVVMVLPPWAMSPADLVAMAKCRKLRRRRFPEDPDPQWTACERLWAKIWDLCTRRKCHWFAITSYNTWVFGAFSTGRTRGFISEPKSFIQREPNVLETLAYWVASSMGLPGGFTLPTVVELVSEVSRDLEIPPFPNDRFPPPPRSDSDWSVNDDVDEEIEEAEVATVLGMAISASGVEEEIIPPPLPDTGPAQTLAERVLAWQEHLPRPCDAKSEAAFSAHTVSSAATSMRSDDLEQLYPLVPENWVTAPLSQTVMRMASY